MTKLQRLKSILGGLMKGIVGVLMICYPDEAYLFILAILSLWLLFSGLGMLSYYLSMARFMVGGKTILYSGLFRLDIALLTITLVDIPRTYILFYLAGIYAFSGVVEIFRARESKTFGVKAGFKFFHGILDVVIALCCVIFYKNAALAGLIYGAGLIGSGMVHIASAFKRTAMIYIR